MAEPVQLGSATWPWRRALVVGVLGLVLVGLSVRTAMDDWAHGARYWGWPSDARHREDLERRAQAAVRSRRLDEAQRIAASSFAAAPAEAVALRILAVVAEGRGEPARAARLYQLAHRRSRRDGATEAWLFLHNVERADFAAAWNHADALLRVHPDLRDEVFPLAATVVQEPAGAAALAQRLRLQPAWRDSFLLYLSQHAASPANTYALFTAMRSAGVPPTTEEVGWHVGRLIREKQFDAAWLAWSQLLPASRQPEAPGLYNGDFSDTTAPPPFNWDLAEGGGGGMAEIAQPPIGAHEAALHVTFNAAVGDGVLARQLLVLLPGTYTLSGRTLVLEPIAAERLVWSLVCAATGLRLGSMVVEPVTGEWAAFQGGFTVPPSECAAQEFRLEGLPGDTLQPVNAWFDQLSIKPVSDSAGDGS